MGSSAIGSVFAIVVIGAVAAVLGLVIDLSNPFFTNLSADASNTIFYLEVGFSTALVIMLIAIVINHWLNEKSAANQGV